MASGNNFARLKENSQDSVMKLEEQCESCKKTLDKAKLLKHIGNSKTCKSYYGSRFKFLKHNQELERKSKYRERKREEINENQRKRREQEKDKKQEKISLPSKGLNCDGEKKESKDYETIRKEEKMTCGFCKKIFDLTSIYKHVANKEECKLFYGPRLEEAIKEHAKQRKKLHRQKDGTEKELAQQRER